MKYIQERVKEYEDYKPELTRRVDFDEFWERTIALSRSVGLNAKLQEVDYPSPYMKVYDLTYQGYDGTPIKGWFLIPLLGKQNKLPCLIHYHGFTGDREQPHQYAHWLMMGMAVIAIDCRLQGGDTGSLSGYPGGLITNVNSLGILNKEDYYYRAVYMDCIRAIDFAASCENIDPTRIVINGASQGGALAMVMAALDNRPALVMADVPSNSNIEARIEGEYGSFACLTDYLRKYPNRLEKVYETISYFDTMNMADKITCPVIASVGLKDNTCPAKLYYATYNRITSTKEITVYPFNGHDGCYHVQLEKKLTYLKKFHIIE